MSVAPDDLLPALRLVPAPDPDPPFADHRPTLQLVAQPQEELPLEWLLPTGLPAAPRSPQLRLVRGRRGDGDDFGPVPTPRGELPEPTAWATRLVQGIAEMLSLDRPVSQLVRWSDPVVFDQVRRRVEVRRRSRAPRDTHSGHRPLVRSIHVAEPADGVAEVCAMVDDGRRPRAYALRLEGLDGRWRATALELV